MGLTRAKPRKLPRHRRIAICDKLAALMREAEPTPFALEGPARAGIRGALCLQRWSWGAADYEASILVMRALQIVDAKRPSWAEGQQEFTQPGVLPIERDNCARCAKPLPEGHYKFCSRLCARAYRQTHADSFDREAAYAREKAARAAWIERQPERQCLGCGVAFRPKYAGQDYHSRDCYQAAHRRFARRNVRMVCETI